ncbi:hypothetical protein LTR37_007551 [Vermiconidia calcicola]|uniref:Uncharacterized protein n=1 Tax=Vermiconidia calcicola TaxID=1690605 RepID=A0ACC3NDE0_9PEZI|nr:hypothetical protein LTR37_007551 [Vermiconidia calcicola]
MMQTGDMRNFQHYILTQTSLGVGEQIYGLGERFGALNKVGQSVVLWNADGGTSSDQAYKNVSFWLSNKGYGIFIDTPQRVELEIGSERSCRVQTSIEGQRLKWYIIYGTYAAATALYITSMLDQRLSGPTPKDVLSRYTTLTGKSNCLPAWSFGLRLTTSFTTEYDENTINGFLEGMRDRDIPFAVFHYDAFWMRPFHWCDFEFMASHFPDPKAQIKRLKESGLVSKISVWINTYIGQASPVFQEAADKGYLLKRKNGDVLKWDLWQAGMGIVDFTNPDACKWFRSKLDALFDIGVDTIKTDFGERIPTKDVQWFDNNVDAERTHNHYAFIYNKPVYEALQERYGKDGAVVFARAACAGTQRFPLQWGGDCESTFEAMAESLRGGLSLGLCGYSFWSVDIGGFEGYPDPTVYKRWLKCRLMPYLYSESLEAVKNGWPLSVRAMSLEFPEDRTAWYCDQQFMLGSKILVAPVFDESGEVEFYLPSGRWSSFRDASRTIDGPKWVTEKHNFETLPLDIREGTILVLGKEGGKRTNYDWTKPEDHEVRIYEPDGESSFPLCDPEGKLFAILKTTEDHGTWRVDVIEVRMR